MPKFTGLSRRCMYESIHASIAGPNDWCLHHNRRCFRLFPRARRPDADRLWRCRPVQVRMSTSYYDTTTNYNVRSQEREEQLEVLASNGLCHRRRTPSVRERRCSEHESKLRIGMGEPTFSCFRIRCRRRDNSSAQALQRRLPHRTCRSPATSSRNRESTLGIPRESWHRSGAHFRFPYRPFVRCKSRRLVRPDCTKWLGARCRRSHPNHFRPRRSPSSAPRCNRTRAAQGTS